jgi:hypothetical protein
MLFVSWQTIAEVKFAVGAQKQLGQVSSLVSLLTSLCADEAAIGRMLSARCLAGFQAQSVLIVCNSLGIQVPAD